MNMKKRAVAYARVSTRSKSQAHSLEFQKSYWNERLAADPDYEYLGLYADSGISGSAMRKRPQFLRMLAKAREGGIDVIFTKSVQRFARNAEELLSVVHELRDMGVSVVFEKEGIDTLEATSDLYLTVAAAVAEDDLSRYRANVVWTINESYRKGVPISFGGRVFGYKVGKGCELTVNEPEAEVVREIFDLYIKGMSYAGIAKHLNESGIKSPNGGIWSVGTLYGILENEKYIGDVMLHKDYQINGLKKKNIGNRVDQYYIEGHHEPIVSREAWEAAQKARQERSNHKLKGAIGAREYPFTGLIECSCCRKKLRHKVNHSCTKYSRPWWRCPSTRDRCTSTAIREDVLEDLFVEAFNEFAENRYRGVEEEDCQSRIEAKEKEAKELVKLYSNGWISKADFDSESSAIRGEIKALTREQASIRSRDIRESDFKKISVFDPEKVRKFIKSCSVSHDTIEFRFYNGVTITKKVKNWRTNGHGKRR